LLIIGSLCYKPIFASGASTVSPIFRILDSFHGTLIVDEGDFRFSDEKAEVVKILNNGNVKGFPVLRSESDGKREFNPRLIMSSARSSSPRAVSSTIRRLKADFLQKRCGNTA
jgi:hypothetical protein